MNESSGFREFPFNTYVLLTNDVVPFPRSNADLFDSSQVVLLLSYSHTPISTHCFWFSMVCYDEDRHLGIVQHIERDFPLLALARAMQVDRLTRRSSLLSRFISHQMLHLRGEKGLLSQVDNN